MYKLASDLKKINMYLNLEICVVCREFLAFKYVLIVISETNLMIIYFYTSEILKNTQFSFVFVWAGREY